MENKSISNFKLLEKNMNYIKPILKIDDKPKLCTELKNKFPLHYQELLVFNQILHANETLFSTRFSTTFSTIFSTRFENIKN